MNQPNRPSRRQFLRQAGLGFGSLALTHLLHEQAAAQTAGPRPTHFPARARAVIWLFMTGGPSQMDTWDYKPELQRRGGQTLAGADPSTGFFSTSGRCLPSPLWSAHLLPPSRARSRATAWLGSTTESSAGRTTIWRSSSYRSG